MRDCTQTLPSIEDVAIKIAFDGMFGTIGACDRRGALGLDVDASEVMDGVVFGFWD
jgi:hypothetical protein